MNAPTTRHTIPDDTLREVAQQHGTPCWVYDAAAIRGRIERLKKFGVVRYAQKANSNVHVLRLLRELGVVVDAVSLGEIERAVAAGFVGSGEPAGIVYASDILDRTVLQRIAQLKIPVNIGSPQMLEQLAQASPGHAVWLRINPGFGSGFNRKTNTGGEFSKHGIWHENVQECYGLIRRHELQLVGLHMHIGSGADVGHLRRVCDAMVNEVRKCPIDIQAVSAGGGLPATYREGDKELDVGEIFDVWSAARATIEAHLGHPVSLEIEPGRYVVANSGCLVSEVRAKKSVGANQFVLVDAGFNDLMRPSMYGSFHQIEIVPQAGAPARGNVRPTIVGGPLCEAGDLFTQEAGGGIVTQDMPEPEVGDLAVFNDAGAYCASMSSNYNSRTLAPEVLLDGGSRRLIRRRQRMDELLALELSCD
ncbi:diaminopimelate decarboxylase [Ramlibacter sp.]|uniref:diaminopimelate decarboxylase n=1 Tax=Ramlibacter sp. TaxID=1917967 RepID=UPI0018281171|nr:diaminopimelate decarboxylase [Ramlibacter sp.]MBA2676321.1 diaminopimelate decarboxylase [Ramlibacter sp.]